MDMNDGVFAILAGIKDDEKRSALVRKLVLNEAYFNLGLLGAMRTKCIARQAKDRNRLILKLRTDSRAAHDLFSVEKGAIGRFKDGLLHIFTAAEAPAEIDFGEWTATDIYHFTLNKIEILKTLVEAGLANEDQLRIPRRLDNIGRGLRALVGKLKA